MLNSMGRVALFPMQIFGVVWFLFLQENQKDRKQWVFVEAEVFGVNLPEALLLMEEWEELEE